MTVGARATMWAATIVATILTGIAWGLLCTHGSDGNSLPFLAVLGTLSALAFIWRLGRALRRNGAREVYPIDRTSDAIAPERAVVMAFLLVFILSLTIPSFYGGDVPPMPDALVPLVFGVFFGLPLVEIYVTKARAWRLFLSNQDPD